MKIRHASILMLFILLSAGCAWRLDPQYTTVEYSVSGNAVNLTIEAVTDEWGTSQTFAVAGLPWSLDYDNDGREMHPPVYLRLEISPDPPPALSGSATSALAGHLVDAAADFVAAGVQVGDVALNAGSGAYSAVTAVAATDLTLTAGDNPFPLGSEAYEIFRMMTITAVVRGDGEVIATDACGAWRSMTATVIAENYTTP